MVRAAFLPGALALTAALAVPPAAAEPCHTVAADPPAWACVGDETDTCRVSGQLGDSIQICLRQIDPT